MAKATKDICTAIDELADEMGTAATYRETIEREISDLEEELSAIDVMLDDADTREEYNKLMDTRKDCELDLKLARNRLRRFNTSPRIAPEDFEGLVSQLSAEVDRAAKLYREKVEKPLAEIVRLGESYDATANRINEAARKLRIVQGPTVNEWTFRRFELSEIYSQAYTDNGRIVHPDLRDALKLADTAKQPTFDTH